MFVAVCATCIEFCVAVVLVSSEEILSADVIFHIIYKIRYVYKNRSNVI